MKPITKIPSYLSPAVKDYNPSINLKTKKGGQSQRETKASKENLKKQGSIAKE